mgnify:CR=1 FL=1
MSTKNKNIGTISLGITENHKYLFDYLPTGVEFANLMAKHKGVMIKLGSMKKYNNLKNAIRKFIYKTRIPLPNVRYSFLKNQEADLIHCVNCLSLNKKPWVVDLEIFWQIVVSNYENKTAVFLAKKIMESKYCKKLYFGLIIPRKIF